MFHTAGPNVRSRVRRELRSTLKRASPASYLLSHLFLLNRGQISQEGTSKKRRIGVGSLCVFGWLLACFCFSWGWFMLCLRSCLYWSILHEYICCICCNTYVCSRWFRTEEKRCLHCEHPPSSTLKSSMATEGIWAHLSERNPWP